MLFLNYISPATYPSTDILSHHSTCMPLAAMVCGLYVPQPVAEGGGVEGGHMPPSTLKNFIIGFVKKIMPLFNHEWCPLDPEFLTISHKFDSFFHKRIFFFFISHWRWKQVSWKLGGRWTVYTHRFIKEDREKEKKKYMCCTACQKMNKIK